MAKAISCEESNALRGSLTPLSSLTNYVGGQVLNECLPPRTATTWGLPDGTEVLRDVLDAQGCRHDLLIEPAGGESRG